MKSLEILKQLKWRLILKDLIVMYAFGILAITSVVIVFFFFDKIGTHNYIPFLSLNYFLNNEEIIIFLLSIPFMFYFLFRSTKSDPDNKILHVCSVGILYWISGILLSYFYLQEEDIISALFGFIINAIVIFLCIFGAVKLSKKNTRNKKI